MAAKPTTALADREQKPVGQTVVVIGGSAALAVHLIANTAVTGASLDIDGGRQLVRA